MLMNNGIIHSVSPIESQVLMASEAAALHH